MPNPIGANKRFTVYLTNHVTVPSGRKSAKLIEVGTIHNGVDNKTYFADRIGESTIGIINASPRIHISNTTANANQDVLVDRTKTFNSISKVVSDLAACTNQKLHAFLFGGFGAGAKKNPYIIDQSHSRFNDMALCIEDHLPETEGIEMPLTTIWGKRNGSMPDTIYARKNFIVLSNPIFAKLFSKKDGHCILSSKGLERFLKKHYEEVQISDNVDLVGVQNFNPKVSTRSNNLNQLA